MAQLIYPIGIQSFQKIRNGGFVYIDKTEYIHRLVTTGQYYFLSRPRRFGKSLLLSTIEAFFKGRRDLFEGLAVMRHEYDWEAHPVFRIDLSGCDGDLENNVTDYLDSFLTSWESEYGLPTDSTRLPGLRFKDVIVRAHEETGKRVVVLVDEYDKPLLETVGKPTLQTKFRNQLRSFYSNLKSQDSHIRFAMLTGVTKFGHLSIFSDLNNLNDISLDTAYSGICGISKEEISKYLEHGIRDFAIAHGKTETDIRDALKENYDGYHFSPEGSLDIYNPFSLLNCLAKKTFGDYWFRTGTPTFLIRLLKERRIPLCDIGSYETSVETLSDVPLELDDPIPVLYQSGYLTIKGYDSRFRSVILGIPNGEVMRGFYNQLLPLYTSLSPQRTSFEIGRFVRDVERGDVDSFMERLQGLFADFQYDSFELRHLEQHYQDVIYLVCKLMGFYTRVEYMTATGRIDMVIQTPEYIYVFEFKLDKSPEDALRQIDTKEYMLPFKSDGRKLVKVGVSFSSEKRGIDNWSKSYA